MKPSVKVSEILNADFSIKLLDKKIRLLNMGELKELIRRTVRIGLILNDMAKEMTRLSK